MSDLDDLRDRLRAFAAERDWDQYHNPKNLAMALGVECAELMEHFQWLTADESAAVMSGRRPAVEEELADILLYLVRLADKLDVDLPAAARAKLAKNAEKYPVHLSKGSAAKYHELGE